MLSGQRWPTPMARPFMDPFLRTSPHSTHPVNTRLKLNQPPWAFCHSDLVSRFYAWPGLSEDVRRFVGNCHTCVKEKFWKEQKRGLLKPLPIPERTWQGLAIGFVVKLPKTKLGNTLIMGVTDRLSK